MDFRQNSNEPSELVFGIIGPIGCNREHVIDAFSKLAPHYSYRLVKVSVSELIRANVEVAISSTDQYDRVTKLRQH